MIGGGLIGVWSLNMVSIVLTAKSHSMYVSYFFPLQRTEGTLQLRICAQWLLSLGYWYLVYSQAEHPAAALDT
jgi:hypothetical protein